MQELWTKNLLYLQAPSTYKLAESFACLVISTVPVATTVLTGVLTAVTVVKLVADGNGSPMAAVTGVTRQ